MYLTDNAKNSPLLYTAWEIDKMDISHVPITSNYSHVSLKLHRLYTTPLVVIPLVLGKKEDYRSNLGPSYGFPVLRLVDGEQSHTNKTDANIQSSHLAIDYLASFVITVLDIEERRNSYIPRKMAETGFSKVNI